MFGQMIRYDKEGFIAKSQPFRFHSGGGHFKGLACAYGVCQEGIAAVKDMRHRIFLMFPQVDFGIHPAKSDMASVILTGADGDDLVVV